MKEADWDRLIDQLESGDCTPFLGAGACEGVLPTGTTMSNRWATRYAYPFADRDDLARVMQYAAVCEGDPVTLKQKVCRYLTAVSPPDFGDPEEPHALLAQFPIPVFITTNYDDFLIRALRSVGKQPNLTMCSWSAWHGLQQRVLQLGTRAESRISEPARLSPAWFHGPAQVARADRE